MSDQAKETPADKLKREKAEAAAAEQAAIDQQKADLAAKQKEADDKSAADDAAMKAHQVKVDAATAAALADNEPEDGAEDNVGANDDATADIGTGDEAAQAAKALENIALSYPLTTPDEHVIFGFSGQMFRLGQLRALFNLKRPR